MKSEKFGERELMSFIDTIKSVGTYDELREVLVRDGKERGYDGGSVAKAIRTHIGYKAKTDQSSLTYLNMTAYEHLMAELTHMDNNEADAVIEKIGELIENEPQQTKDEEEKKRIAARTKELKIIQKREEAEIEELKGQISSGEESLQIEDQSKEEWALPPKQATPVKKWYQFWK